MVDVEELSCCDCSRQQCQDVFDAYATVKASTRSLQTELAELKKKQQHTSHEISDMERNHAVQLQDRDDQIASLLERVQSLSKSLEHERQLRMEDIFKLEFQKKETSRAETELAEIRRQWIDALAALPNLQSENKLLKRQVDSHMDTIEKLNAELRTRNYDVAMLEDRNTHLRVRLSETETKLAKVLRSSATNARISSSMGLTAGPLPALKSTQRVLGSSTTGSTELPTAMKPLTYYDSSILDKLLVAARPTGAMQNSLRYSYSTVTPD